MTALDAAVATHHYFENGWAPAQRLVRQPPDHAVARLPVAAAASAPVVQLHDPADEDCPVRLDSLSHHLEA